MVAGVASALLLAGCVSAPVAPAPPTAGEVQEYNQRILDLTYDHNNLDGVTARLMSSRLTDADSDGSALSYCLSDAGIISAGYGFSSSEGFSLGTVGTTRPPKADRVRLYRCVAAHPVDPSVYGGMVSVEEREYLWQRWTGWVIPCLETAGYRVRDFPSKKLFFDGNVPIYLSPYNLLGLSNEQYAEVDPTGRPVIIMDLEARCGSPFGAIDRLDHEG